MYVEVLSAVRRKLGEPPRSCSSTSITLRSLEEHGDSYAAGLVMKSNRWASRLDIWLVSARVLHTQPATPKRVARFTS